MPHEAAPLPVPVAFGPCFGWFHAPAAGRARDRGVVICPPFGVEALRTHRNLRILAGSLAEAGLSVLRFDYPGTGDSWGGEGPACLERCLASVVEAAEFLRRRSGTTEVSLCGLRLGGLFAALAARSVPNGPCRLALLAPVTSGADYARELTLLERVSPHRRPCPGRVEVAGFVLHDPELRWLERFDLHDALLDAAPAAVLVLDVPTARLRGDPWRRQLAAAGTALSVQAFDGYKEFMRETHLAATPDADFARTAAFLAEAAGPAVNQPARPAFLDVPTALGHAGVTEVPVTFGPADDLFGLLCAPGRPVSGRPAVVVVNTGSNHRIGDGRYAVLLARELAAEGLASLRIDIGGIGDSCRPVAAELVGGGPDAHRRARVRLFGQQRTADVGAALDLLQQRGYGPFTVVGVCSGARHALDAALVDPRITGLVLANLPSFRATGMVEATLRPVSLPQKVGRAILGAKARYKLIYGVKRTRAAVERALGTAFAPAAAVLGFSQAGRAGHALRALSARPAEVLLLYSRGDPGLLELEACFGPRARRLARIARVSCSVIEGSDHAFATSFMRDELVAQIKRHARRVHQPAQAEPAGVPQPGLRRACAGLIDRVIIPLGHVSRDAGFKAGKASNEAGR